MLRCHIKVPDPRYLEAADETGMLVWYEIPVWNDAHFWTAEAAQRGVDTFRAEVERDWNHPSIVIQSIMNEQWGMDVTAGKSAGVAAQHLPRFQAAYSAAGPLDHRRQCLLHGLPPAIGFRRLAYVLFHPRSRGRTGQPGCRSMRAVPNGSSARMAMPSPRARSRCWFRNSATGVCRNLPPRDQLPWWFPRDFDGRELTRAAGVFDRLHSYGFDRIYPDYDALALATERHEYLALKYEIEQMRQQNSIQGYVITELTDANWEANGLMSMWRQPKTFRRRIGQAAAGRPGDGQLCYPQLHCRVVGGTSAGGVALFHRGSGRSDHRSGRPPTDNPECCL